MAGTLIGSLFSCPKELASPSAQKMQIEYFRTGDTPEQTFIDCLLRIPPTRFPTVSDFHLKIHVFPRKLNPVSAPDLEFGACMAYVKPVSTCHSPGHCDHQGDGFAIFSWFNYDHFQNDCWESNANTFSLSCYDGDVALRLLATILEAALG